MKFRCKCSGVGECSFKYFKISKQCKECGKKEIGNKNRLSYESIKTEFASVGCTLLEEDYKNAHTPMKYICVCGHESKITYTHFKSGQRCINCRNNKIAEKLRKYSIEEIKSDFEKEGYTLLEEDYINYTKSMRYICSRGHKNKTSLASFYNNRRCKECWRLDHLGENHPSWKHEITREERLFQRNYPEYREWRTKVFERDNFTCQFCGIKGAKLEAHHLDGYNWCKEKRIDVDNGKTLCEECHNDFHSIHGRGNNTREQFNRWLRNSLKRDAM
jgi:5-methylcytosine-specific restriction endonuclease McrA